MRRAEGRDRRPPSRGAFRVASWRQRPALVWSTLELCFRRRVEEPRRLDGVNGLRSAILSGQPVPQYALPGDLQNSPFADWDWPPRRGPPRPVVSPAGEALSLSMGSTLQRRGRARRVLSGSAADPPAPAL
ncbi:hypothetical protein GCM10020220_112110 [Nonomuraea rubra]